MSAIDKLLQYKDGHYSFEFSGKLDGEDMVVEIHMTKEDAEWFAEFVNQEDN